MLVFSWDGYKGKNQKNFFIKGLKKYTYLPNEGDELMFNHILIPTDCTQLTKHALDLAINMFLHSKLQVPKITLLHVIETVAEDDEALEFERFYNSLKKRAQKKMEQLIQDYPEHKDNIESRILLGNRVNEILNFAQENNIDLIMLNSRKTDMNNPIQGWGTISHKVGILSQCPVMLVK